MSHIKHFFNSQYYYFYYYYYYTSIMASFPGQPGQGGARKIKPVWISEAWGFEMQWHQLDHMQIICTSLQTDNHTNTPSLNIYRPDALPDAQPTVSKQ